jgi:hypothetical protein
MFASYASPVYVCRLYHHYPYPCDIMGDHWHSMNGPLAGPSAELSESELSTIICVALAVCVCVQAVPLARSQGNRCVPRSVAPGTVFPLADVC